VRRNALCLRSTRCARHNAARFITKDVGNGHGGMTRGRISATRTASGARPSGMDGINISLSAYICCDDLVRVASGCEPRRLAQNISFFCALSPAYLRFRRMPHDSPALPPATLSLCDASCKRKQSRISVGSGFIAIITLLRGDQDDKHNIMA